MSFNFTIQDLIPTSSVQDGKLVLEPIRQSKYTLEELLADVEELSEELPWGSPQGKEV